MDDGKFFIKVNVLDDELKKVKELIIQLQSVYSDILVIENIMEELCQDGKDDEVFLKYFKLSVEVFSKFCGIKF